MQPDASSAVLISFKLQSSKTKAEAIEAMNGINEHFEGVPASVQIIRLHDPETDTFHIVQLFASEQDRDPIGKEMISSGAGDRLFSIVDPATFSVTNLDLLE